MALFSAYDIAVHYEEKQVKIPNIDPIGYCYLNLLFDVAEKVFGEVPGHLNKLIHMRCQIPKTDRMFDISDDDSVHEMFEMHKCGRMINVHVQDMDVIPSYKANQINENGHNTDLNLREKGKDKVCVVAIDDSEGEYSDSSSDSSWLHSMDSDNEKDLDVHSDSGESDMSFSDFDDTEEGALVPYSENEEETDPVQQALKSKLWTYNPKVEIEFKKGELFTNVDAFRAALKDYVIQKGFPIVRLKNEKSRVTAVCGVEGCKWRIHASPVLDSMTFMIKTYQGEHTCVMDRKNTEATADWIAKKLVPIMRIHPNMSTKGVEAEMIKYGVHPSKWQMYRALTKARNEIEGNHIESYAKLPKYAELIRKYNPQSICKIHYDRPTLLVEPRFLRMFISFKAQRSGFVEGCRPFVGFDGCFLKGSYGGVLLTAVTLDANNSIFPIAFAVAEAENKETWSWFFHYFEEFFGPFTSESGFHGPLTFMSDRQKGLNIAYEEKVPVASGRHCCRHICSNFKAQFPGILLSNLFWRAAKSFDVAGHNEAMASIKELNIEAWKYLDKIPKTTWCRYTFNTGLKCDHVTNNCTESFNAWIGELRGKPILTLVDGLRKKFMKKMHKRYQKGCMLTTAITPKMLGKLQKIGQVSRQCELTMASTDVFEVGDMNRSYIVNLSAKTCDCGAFQISGLPCKHAALGIIYKREKLESYCEHWFSRDKYLKTYSSMIHPIPDEKMWPPMPYVTPVTVLPPPLRRAPGRPKTKMRREHDEGQSASQPKRHCYIKCGNCGSFGHNKRSCQGAPVTE
ncbi:uncharacterized protein [Coffea arabica]|uniref:SWIM-type domain-containing protein n=1 Tax=Coffea arabica TaxID=13443 RepID=A0ABM4X4P9_COFAR